MEQYDCIVIGAGSGLNVASAYAKRGKDVAVIEPGPMGGTCLNRGCIPSKMLIHRAEIIDTINESESFHIDASVEGYDFASMIEEVNDIVSSDAESIEHGIKNSDNHTLYKSDARFVDDKVVEVDGEKLTADTIVIAAGTRAMVPPIDGLDQINYLTSTEALRETDKPDSLAVIGGGYIAAELAYFYGAFDTDITIIEMSDVMLGHEDREISETFTKQFSERHTVLTGMAASEVGKEGEQVAVTAEAEDGSTKTVTADELLVAAGRIPNTDELSIDETSIKTDDRGFVETDETLETAVDGVYALGDIAGNYLFKHSANLESRIVFENAFNGRDVSPDYTGMPHAVFTNPEIAGVGQTEQELEASDQDYEKATYPYKQTGRGLAIKEENGYVKVLADPETREILGCHIIGPNASELIHEVLVAMRHGSGTVDDISDTIHVHPALNEVVERAFHQL